MAYSRRSGLLRTISAFLTLAGLAVAGDSNESLRVLYTGKLLGYARSPNVQRFVQCPCPPPAASDSRKMCYTGGAALEPSIAARQLREQIADLERSTPPKSGTLLVGAGDNFAMDYLSRVVVLRDNQGKDSYRAKDELVYWRGVWWDLAQFSGPDDPVWKVIEEDQAAGQSSISYDNVANFFREAGYAALVPGKHDFYFGPERLRHLGRLLESGTAEKPGVALLAANLIIRTKLANPPPPRPEFRRQQDRPYAIAADDLKLKWQLPKTVLPWLRSVRIAGDGVSQLGGAEICRQEKPDEKPSDCQPMMIRTPPGEEGKSVRLLDLPNDFVLQGELNYLACASVIGQSRPFCTPFSVASPFFQYPDRASKTMVGNEPLAPRLQHRFSTGIRPYVVDAKTNAVIFGVVAQGMENLVGVLNTQWINQEESLDTGAVTIDPSEALTQMLQYCEGKRDCHPGRTYILLAQMPRDAAAVLNRAQKDRFHIVISQADNRIATVAGVKYPAQHPPLVVVPPEIFEAGRKDELQSRVPYVDLTVGPLDDTTRKVIVAAETGEAKPGAFSPGLSSDACLHRGVAEAWKQLSGERLAGAPTPEHFQLVLLEAMRNARKADVALLQVRDLFELKTRLGLCQNSPIATEGVRASLEQILWKGDFVMTRTIKGSALAAALKRSKDLKDAEDDVYSIELEKGRWLLVHGAVEDAGKKQWYVNGQPLENNTLYSVAMTDFLAFGDTGYPELGVPATPPSERLNAMGRLPRIADLMVKAVGGEEKRILLNFATYLDQSHHRPMAKDPPAGFRDHMASLINDAWTVPRPILPPPNGTPAPKNTAPGAPLTTPVPPPPTTAQRGQAIGQSRTYWRYFLDKAEFGYSNYSHNQRNQQALINAFSGIPESGVLNRQRSAWTSAIQFEVRREWARNQWFARFEEEYTAERTQQDREFGMFLLNYPLNSISGESGVRLGWSPTMRRRPWYAWLLSVNGGSQFRSPFLDLKPGIPCGPKETERCPDGDTFRERTARTARWLGKFGLSWQGQENWAEGGLFYGRVIRPVSYTLTYEDPAPDGPRSVELNCDLASDLWNNGRLRSLSNCFAAREPAASAAVEDWSLRFRSEANTERGLFLNFNLRWDLPRRKVGIDQFFVEHRGRWFFNTQNDLALDTRVSSLLKLGPTLKLFPSLNLKPTFSLFHFQNRIGGTLLRGRTFEFKLEYRFNRKSGDSWGQAFKSGWAK